MEDSQATYGIIGYPVSHSLSPLMHNAAFKALKVDASYKLFPLREEELDSFFAKLKEKASPIFGLNVTVPYKERVVKYIDNLSPLAQKIMAVNTIVITPERSIIGYNTDAPGFMAHLTELKFNFADKRIAILGAGGSARAILATLCLIPERPQSIKIYNRTGSRTEVLLNDLGERIDMSMVEPVSSVEDLNVELADLLINTTSLGLKDDDDSLIEAEMFHPDLLVYDLIYNPKETKLLKMAKRKGAKVANGLGMLYYQGILSFQHWANMELDQKIKKKMRDAIEKAVI